MASSTAQELRDIARRLERLADVFEQSPARVVELGRSCYDRGAGVVSNGDQHHELTRAEATILNCLIDNRGAIVERDAIHGLLFGSDLVVSRTVDTHISHLRSILGSDAIATAHGRGYRLVPQDRLLELPDAE